MKNVTKNKFFLCFRPVVHIDAMLDDPLVAVDRSANCRFACLPVADKHEMKIPETKSLFFNQGSRCFTENWIMHQPPKRTLSRLIKAVVFETILNRKTRRENRYRQDSSLGSKSSYWTYTESSSAGDEKSISSLASVGTNSQETMSPESSLSSSYSYGSASSSSSPQVSESKNLSKYYSNKESNDQHPLEKQKKFECYGIYLVLISLALTVFWGKFFGIILTTIWLCFFSLCFRLPKEVAKLPKTESEVYKNRGRHARSAPRNYHYGH